MSNLKWLTITAFCCGVNLMSIPLNLSNGDNLSATISAVALVISIFAVVLNYPSVKGEYNV